jgi:hypothetical protein
MTFISVTKFRSSFALCAGLLLSCSVAWAQKVDTTPEFEIGDRWTFKYTNIGDRKEPYTYTLQTIASKDGSAWLYGESKDPNTKREKYIQRFDYKRGKNAEGFEFSPTETHKAGKRYGNWQPQNDWILFPLEVGKKFKFEQTWDDGSGANEFDAVVEAFENVKTEAGEFEAYRIKYTGWWNRNTGEGGSGKLEMIRWWAPAIKREIKYSFKNWTGRSKVWANNETELMKWEPKAALPTGFENK